MPLTQLGHDGRPSVVPCTAGSRDSGRRRAHKPSGEPSQDRITSVASWQDSPYFTGAERAASALVDAVLQPPADGWRVSDGLYAQAAEHYEGQPSTTRPNRSPP
ncbi:hypothetical protein ACIPC1_11990 [Streptomyces sp. NPDC087263]|uniref:hypothetical protein n=1 Tax=Streptomyces sp. NPDC087263 TaxID=3365773 RepID=UPI003826ADA0